MVLFTADLQSSSPLLKASRQSGLIQLELEPANRQRKDPITFLIILGPGLGGNFWLTEDLLPAENWFAVWRALITSYNIILLCFF